jgi:hypothetical protein
MKCETCGKAIEDETENPKCNNCLEIEMRLKDYLSNWNAIHFVEKELAKALNRAAYEWVPKPALSMKIDTLQVTIVRDITKGVPPSMFLDFPEGDLVISGIDRLFQIRFLICKYLADHWKGGNNNAPKN